MLPPRTPEALQSLALCGAVIAPEWTGNYQQEQSHQTGRASSSSCSPTRVDGRVAAEAVPPEWTGDYQLEQSHQSGRAIISWSSPTGVDGPLSAGAVPPELTGE